MAQYLFSFTVLLLSLSTLRLEATPTDDQTRFLKIMKKSLPGNLLAGWNVNGSKPACNYTCIKCNNLGYVMKIDVSGWSLSGRFLEDVCTYFLELRILRLGHNHLHRKFPDSITNCSSLEELNMTSTYLSGTLPDLSQLISLKMLDFPEVVSNSTTLKILSLYGNSLTGEVPKDLGKWSSMIAIDLSENQLSGELPTDTCIRGKLLYFCAVDNMFSGGRPETFGSRLSLLAFEVGKIVPLSPCRGIIGRK